MTRRKITREKWIALGTFAYITITMLSIPFFPLLSIILALIAGVYGLVSIVMCIIDAPDDWD